MASTTQKVDLTFIRSSTIGSNHTSQRFAADLYMKKVNGEKVIGGLNDNNPDNLFRRMSDTERQKI